jgi:NitT/TauT family transport system substrate-binding protein
MKRRRFLQGSAALVASLAAPRVHAQSRGKIDLLVTTSPPDVNAHYFWWTRENGFYRDAGIDISMRSIVADTTTVRGLLAGEGDVGWAGAGSGMQAMAAGSQLRIVSSFAPRLDFLVLASKEVANLKALEGRAFAVSQVGAVSQVVSRLMIERAGGDSSKVQWLGVGSPPSRFQALSTRRVDATVLTGLQALNALRDPSLHVIGEAVGDLPNFLYSWEIAPAEAINAKPDAFKAFVAATSRGIAWAMEHTADAARISQKLLPNAAPADVAHVIENYAKIRYFDPSGVLRPQDWDYTVDVMMKNGDLAKPLNYADYVVTDFVKALPATR